jgi:hypothetical protein
MLKLLLAIDFSVMIRRAKIVKNGYGMTFEGKIFYGFVL